jgi:hypothetical protein
MPFDIVGRGGIPLGVCYRRPESTGESDRDDDCEYAVQRGPPRLLVDATNLVVPRSLPFLFQVR